MTFSMAVQSRGGSSGVAEPGGTASAFEDLHGEGDTERGANVGTPIVIEALDPDELERVLGGLKHNPIRRIASANGTVVPESIFSDHTERRKARERWSQVVGSNRAFARGEDYRALFALHDELRRPVSVEIIDAHTIHEVQRNDLAALLVRFRDVRGMESTTCDLGLPEHDELTAIAFLLNEAPCASVGAGPSSKQLLKTSA